MSRFHLPDWEAPGLAPDHLPQLSSGEVHLWRADLLELAPLVSLVAGLLAPEEQERVSRISQSARREQGLLSQAFVRLVLGMYLRRPPQAIVIERAPGGKPRLSADDAKGAVTWSLSHAGTLLVLGVGTGSEIGVDLEWRGRAVDAVALSRRYFAPEEADRIAQTAAQDQVEVFLQYWTAKEAVCKANGRGIAGMLSTTILQWSGEQATVVVGQPVGKEPAVYRVRFCDPVAGSLAAMAVEDPAVHLRYWDGSRAVVEGLLALSGR